MDHVGPDRELYEAIAVRLNKTRHEPWPAYYTPALADRVYRAYEADFSRFAYPRTLSDVAAP